VLKKMERILYSDMMSLILEGSRARGQRKKKGKKWK
jgi:hypothetical protein